MKYLMYVNHINETESFKFLLILKFPSYTLWVKEFQGLLSFDILVSYVPVDNIICFICISDSSSRTFYTFRVGKRVHGSFWNRRKTGSSVFAWGHQKIKPSFTYIKLLCFSVFFYQVIMKNECKGLKRNDDSGNVFNIFKIRQTYTSVYPIICQTRLQQNTRV